MEQATPNNSSASNETVGVDNEVSKYKILPASEFAKREEIREAEEMLFLTQRFQKKLDRLELHQNKFEIRVSNTFSEKTVSLFTKVVEKHGWKVNCQASDSGVIWLISC